MRPLIVLIILFILSACDKDNNETALIQLIAPIDTVVNPTAIQFEWTSNDPGPFRLKVVDKNNSIQLLDTVLLETSFLWKHRVEFDHSFVWSVNLENGTEAMGNFKTQDLQDVMSGDYPVTVRYVNWYVSNGDTVSIDTTYPGVFNLFVDDDVLWVSEGTSGLNARVDPDPNSANDSSVYFATPPPSHSGVVLDIAFGNLFFLNDSLSFTGWVYDTPGYYTYFGKR